MLLNTKLLTHNKIALYLLLCYHAKYMKCDFLNGYFLLDSFCPHNLNSKLYSR